MQRTLTPSMSDDKERGKGSIETCSSAEPATFCPTFLYCALASSHFITETTGPEQGYCGAVDFQSGKIFHK